MLAYTYVSKGDFQLREKAKPELLDEKDAFFLQTGVCE